MKTIKIVLGSAFLLWGAISCHRLEGDNSDYDFSANRGTESLYSNGYGRLENSLRLASYNVHRCEGPITQDPTKDVANYNNTAKVISLIDPDVIAIQELDQNTTWHQTSQINELATRTGMYATFGKTIDQRGGEYGNGILSKTEPESYVNLAIPQVDTEYEKRAVIVAEFADYVFLATHFCHRSSANRKAAVEFISAYVSDTYGAEYAKPIYLAGDLNEDKVGSDVMLTLQNDWKIISSNDYTSGNARIDYVLVYMANNPTYEVLGEAVPTFDEIDVYTVSDHMPTMVDLAK